jgi:hypothetical protein
MQEAILEALQALTPPENIVGIYAKGSGVKPWDTPLDYVPELSDVDVQVLLKDESSFKTLETAIEFQERLERLFKHKAPRHLHYPRPQVIFVKERWTSPTFKPSPEHTVKVLYGKPYAQAHPMQAEPSILDTDLDKLLKAAEFLQEFPESILDKPGKYTWLALRGLAWRVGPIASRVLTLLGADFQTAWGHNRTEVVAELHRRGELDLKDCYERFYSEAWEFFIEGDPYVARRCLMAGYAAIERAVEIAQEFATPSRSALPASAHTPIHPLMATSSTLSPDAFATDTASTLFPENEVGEDIRPLS